MTKKISKSKREKLAKVALLPELSAINAIRHFTMQDASVGEMIGLTQKHIQAIQAGDLTQIERYLYSQGIALNALFDRLFGKVATATSLHELQAYGQLALKAQAQSRVAFTALADLRNPHNATFIKQQNNAINQQVNNQIDQGNEILENGQIREVNHATLGHERTKETIAAYPKMEAMGTLYRPENS